MEPLRDPVVEERYGRQVAAFKNAAGEPICDIAVIPYQCIPILVHLDPAAVNKTVPWPSVREAHPLLTEMDRLRYQHWNCEPYRNFCRRLGLDPDCNRPIFEPSMAAVGEALVLRACTDHEEQTKLTRTFFGSGKTSLLHKLVAFLRVGGDRSLDAYDRIQSTLAEIRDDLVSDPDRLLITRAMVEAGRLVVEPEPEPEPHGPVVLVIGDPGPFTAERDEGGFLSRLVAHIRRQRWH
jgi:hypothetical protein